MPCLSTKAASPWLFPSNPGRWIRTGHVSPIALKTSRLGLRHLGLRPLPMFLDQIDQALHRVLLGDIEFDRRLADVEIDFSGRSADVPEICIGHLTGPVHNATHDGNLHALEMLRPRLNSSGNGLKVKQSAPATGTGYIIGLERTASSRLQNIVGQTQ